MKLERTALIAVSILVAHVAGSEKGFAQYTITALGSEEDRPSRANCISDSGWIVGSFRAGDEPRGFLMCGAEQALEELSVLEGYEEFLHTARAVNENGLIVGMTQAPDGGNRAVLWISGSAVQLNPLPGYSNADAMDINSAGIVVGGCWEPAVPYRPAVRWVQGVPEELEPLPGSQENFARAINDSGFVVGSCVGLEGYRRAVVWGPDGRILLEIGVLDGDLSSQAMSVNNSGWVVGWSRPATGQDKGFLWDGNQLLDLSPLELASAINDYGTIVGSIVVPGDANYEPAIWRDGAVTLLPSLDGVYHFALDINNVEEIIGVSANQAVYWGVTPVPSNDASWGDIKSMYRN